MCALNNVQRYYINPNQAEILRNRGYSVQQDGDRFYYSATAKTNEALQALLNGSTPVEGAKAPQGAKGLTVEQSKHRPVVENNLPNSEVTVNLQQLVGNDKKLLALLQQEGYVSQGTDITKLSVLRKPEDLMNKLNAYFSDPQNMQTITFGENSDKLKADFKDVINPEPNEDGSYNIKEDKRADFIKIYNDENYTKETHQDGQPEEVTFTETKKGEVVDQSKIFNKLVDSKWISKTSPEQLDALEKQGIITKVGKNYYVSGTNASIPVAEPKPADEESVKLQKKYLEIYDNNSEMAETTLVKTKYFKEYQTVKRGFTKIAESQNTYEKKYGDPQNFTLKAKYYSEYATDEERANLKSDVTNRTMHYLKIFDANTPKDEQLSLIRELKGAASKYLDKFDKSNSDEEFLTALLKYNNAGIEQLVETIALSETFDNMKTLDETQIDRMAQKIVIDKCVNKNEDRGDYATLMTEGYLKVDKSKEKFNKTVVHFNKQGKKDGKALKDGMNHTEIGKKGREFVEKSGYTFAQKDENGNPIKCTKEEADFTIKDKNGNPVYCKFDGNAWKNFWLSQSNGRRADSVRESDVAEYRDYYATLDERSGNAREGIADIYNKLSNGKDKVTDRKWINTANDFYKSAGIDTEANNDAGVKLASLGIGALEGAGVAVGAQVLSNVFSGPIKIPFAGKLLAEFSGSKNVSFDYTYSGVIEDIDKFRTDVYKNGVLIDQIYTEETEYHNYSGSGTTGGRVDFHDQKEVGYSGTARDFDLFRGTPFAAIAGSIGGGIKAALNLKNVHDEKDGNSDVRELAIQNLNDYTPPVQNIEETTSNLAFQRKQIVLGKKVQNSPVEYTNEDYRILRTKPKPTTYKGQPATYRMFQDKKDLVSAYYGIPKNDPRFEKIYTYVMKNINGLNDKQLGTEQYADGLNYHFPELIPTGEIDGITEDLPGKKADLSQLPLTVRVIYTDNAAKGFKNKNNNIQGKQSSAYTETATLRTKRK